MTYSKESILSDMKKAKGLGSAHHGAMHKLAHDITTILNIPLVAWVIYTIVSLRDASYEEFVAWMSHPVSIVVAILFVIVTLKHFALELQVVFEDYISIKWLRMLKVVGMNLFFLALGIATIISILKLAFTAGV